MNAVNNFLLDALHKRCIEEKKQTSLLVVFLGKALNEIPSSLCGKQMMGSSSLPVTVAQSEKRLANEA